MIFAMKAFFFFFFKTAILSFFFLAFLQLFTICKEQNIRQVSQGDAQGFSISIYKEKVCYL